jgi:hypothetical protein
MQGGLCAILPWIGRVIVTGTAALAAYVVFHPSVAGPYGSMAGVLAVGLFGFCTWLIGRATVYLLGGD